MESIDKNIKSVEGNIKHEQMYLSEKEKDLIKRLESGEITREEFVSLTLRHHEKNID